MENLIDIVGGGLAGSEAALQLASRGVHVRLIEMRPVVQTPVHTGEGFAELVCSNSLKSTKPDSAAGMLKTELAMLGSQVFACAQRCAVPAGGALAVDRDQLSACVTKAIEDNPLIEVVRAEARGISAAGKVLVCRSGQEDSDELPGVPDAIILASGPLTSDALATSLQAITGKQHLAFYDAAAPIVMADSLDYDKLFTQSRYEDEGIGDYLNAPFSREAYDEFIEALLAADRVIAKDFETRELFQACQPIEEIARKGHDAPRFGTLKPVGLIDPHTGCRPWAALQLRAEDAQGASYNLVGFQTNLTFSEQRRVFGMIPGLQQADFARYGVMHRNTFIDAPHLLGSNLQLVGSAAQGVPTAMFVAGQLSGTEGYCEAIASGLFAALFVYALVAGVPLPDTPRTTAFGALLAYATDSEQVKDYQPMHVNFGIMEPLEVPVKNKRNRYAAYAQRGTEAMRAYCDTLRDLDILARGDEAGG
ncbi:MAG: methylenetetrahydrofolate--tRNA-(uracil(54)-C(5))-methyltransferase (FADH(2)-oxidizing) TrmFO [Raoultibacter sp.]